VFVERQKTLRMAPMLARVLVVDPQVNVGRMIGDLMRDIAHSQTWTAQTNEDGLKLARTINPDIVFVALDEGEVDAVTFTKAFRRAGPAYRKAPVIVIAAAAKAPLILAARDAGAHEFLAKPFTTKVLVRKLEAVILQHRDWIEAMDYIGPDRRRFNTGDGSGHRRRRSDRPENNSEAGRIEQALKILRSAVLGFERDRTQAMRSMLAQTIEIMGVAGAGGYQEMAAAATALHGFLNTNRAFSKEELDAKTAKMLSYLPAAPRVRVA
jgi:two-component system, response regulator PdtaR